MIRAPFVLLFGLAVLFGAGPTGAQEPPALQAEVDAGTLPPLAQRLPRVPLVVDINRPDWTIGRYGGELRTLMAKDRDIRMMVVYGYARLVGYDDKLQLVPDHLFSLWNRVALGPNWAFGVGVVYQSSSFATLDNRVELPGFARTDAAVYYTLVGAKTRLALNVENVFDRKYTPTADGNNNISPGAPRNVQVTLATSF